MFRGSKGGAPYKTYAPLAFKTFFEHIFELNTFDIFVLKVAVQCIANKNVLIKMILRGLKFPLD